MKESVLQVEKTIVELDIDQIQAVIQRCLDEGVPAWEIVEGMSSGMSQVGKQFEIGEYYLSDLVLSGEMMKEGMALLENKFDMSQMGKKGTVILATAKGDIHDIGKNIVGTMLTASGFKTIDLGVDVHEDQIIEAMKSSGSNLIALSVLLTTMVSAIKDLVDALSEAGLRDKTGLAIGGACCSQQLADEMGVDAYGEDAVKAVGIFEQLAESIK
jgi:methanogenic corrinoid protein MtbC1